MITIYHLSNSRSERVIWLMEELGLPYELVRFERTQGMTAPDGLKQVHPMGKAPAIRDGDLVLAESGAILEYIVNRYGGGRLAVRPESADYPYYLQWMHAAEGSAMTQGLLHLYLGVLIQGVDQSSWIVQRVQTGTAALLAYIDGELARRPYFGGQEFSAADIMMKYCFGLLVDMLKQDPAPYPNLAAWQKRVEARPAYGKAMAIANPPKVEA